MPSRRWPYVFGSFEGYVTWLCAAKLQISVGWRFPDDLNEVLTCR